MFRLCRLTLMLAAAAGSVGPAAFAAPPERSVSTSRQFLVYGGDVRLRGALADLAEQTKRQLLSLAPQPDTWKTPIVINAQAPEANFPEARDAMLNLSQTGTGLKLQLDLLIRPDVNAPAIQRELLRALLLEIGYRDQSSIPVDTRFNEPPAWLIDGVATRLRGGSGLAETVARAIESGAAPSLADFLRQRPELLDATSRTIHGAYSASLVELIVSSPDGRAQLGKFVRDLHSAPADPLADLVAHFPAFCAEPEKTWASGLKRIAGGNAYAMLGVAETERELDALLHIEVRDGNGDPRRYAIEDFQRLPRVRGAQPALQRLSEQLLLLEPRANPVYRAIVVEYQELATLLARGKSPRVAERLARVKEWRAQLATRMARIDDYLNWFEATQSTTPSGLFAEYLKSAAEAETAERARRRDPISVYLDSLEAQIDGD